MIDVTLFYRSTQLLDFSLWSWAIQATLQNSLLPGLLLVWPTITTMLKTSDFIDDEDDEDFFGLMWVIISVLSVLSKLPGGWINDYYGPRTLAVFINATITVSMFIVSIASTKWPLYISAIGIGCGTNIQTCTLAIADIFGENRALYMTINVLTITFPIVMFFIGGFLTTGSSKIISYRTWFAMYSIIGVFITLHSLYFFPDILSSRRASMVSVITRRSVTAQKKRNSMLANAGNTIPEPKIISNVLDIIEDEALQFEKTQMIPGERMKDLEEMSVSEALCTKEFIALCTYFTMGVLVFYYFLGVLADNTIDISGKDLSQAYNVVFLITIVPICLGNGYVINNYGFFPLCVTSVVSIVLVGILFSVYNTTLQYFAFCFLAAFYATFCGQCFTQIGTTFGLKKFGVLSGIALFSSGIVSNLQLALYVMTDKLGDRRPTNLMMAGLGIFLAPYPFYLYYWEKKNVTFGTQEDDDSLADLIVEFKQGKLGNSFRRENSAKPAKKDETGTMDVESAI